MYEIRNEFMKYEMNRTRLIWDTNILKITSEGAIYSYHIGML